MTHVDGEKVRSLREDAKLSRDDFMVKARELGHEITSRTLASLENGETAGGVRLSTLNAVAAVLGVKIDALLVDDAA